jgi:hypothetical protein
MSNPPAPPIRFADVLQELIDNSAFRKNRRPIWEELNITSAALSQYLSGQTRPRLETLVGLAHFFGVSLDYLLLGKEASAPPPEEARPFVRYVDWALADVQDRISSHNWLVGRIGHRIAQRIDDVARDLTLNDSLAGLLTIEDQMLIESYSLHTKILCTNLENDLVFTEDGEVTAGRFLPILARNIKARPPRPYEFLLPLRWDDKPWEDLIHLFRKVLVNKLGLTHEELRYCEFRRIQRRSFCGTVLYKLDVALLREQEPTFWETIRTYVHPTGWLGHILNPNVECPMQTNALMGPENVTPALELYNEWWDHADADI